MTSAKVRPFLVRPGANYTCFGDGLCCTDIHGLGPITKDEYVQIRRLDRSGAHYDEGFEDRMLKTAPDGGCHFLLPDLRCGVHAEFGPEAKPDGCRRFPLGLVATPDGGRITTRHRCPCRTMGERPPVTEEAALSSISEVGKDGELKPRADETFKKIRMGRKKVSFAAWREIEDALLANLAAGMPAEDVLGASGLPALKKGKEWSDFAQEFVEAIDGTSFGYAAAWMGEAVRCLLDENHHPRLAPRTWKTAFDAAEKRPGAPRTEDAVFNDWIADEIWSLEWAGERGWEIARYELGARVSIARWISSHLQKVEGCRPDRAAAEAVMVVELIGESEFWSEVVERIKRPE